MHRILVALLVSQLCCAPVAFGALTYGGISRSGNIPPGVTGTSINEETMKWMQGLDTILFVNPKLSSYFFSPGALEDSSFTGTPTVNVLADSSASMVANEYIGKKLIVTSGKAAPEQTVILANTATGFTVEALSVAPIATDTYQVFEGHMIPGDDTTGDGTFAKPWRTIARMNTVINLTPAILELDSATWVGGDWGGAVQVNFTAAAPCPWTDRLCWAIRSVARKKSEPFVLDCTGVAMVTAGVIGNVTGGLWSLNENILFKNCPNNPNASQDLMRTTDGRVVALNVTAEHLIGDHNQLFTTHGNSTLTGSVLINMKASHSDPDAYAPDCTATPGVLWDDCLSAGVIDVSGHHGIHVVAGDNYVIGYDYTNDDNSATIADPVGAFAHSTGGGSAFLYDVHARYTSTDTTVNPTLFSFKNFAGADLDITIWNSSGTATNGLGATGSGINFQANGANANTSLKLAGVSFFAMSKGIDFGTKDVTNIMDFDMECVWIDDMADKIIRQNTAAWSSADSVDISNSLYDDADIPNSFEINGSNFQTQVAAQSEATNNFGWGNWFAGGNSSAITEGVDDPIGGLPAASVGCDSPLCRGNCPVSLTHVIPANAWPMDILGFVPTSIIWNKDLDHNIGR